MTLAQAIELLKTVIEFNKRHADYDHVVSLAKLYRQVITGAGVEDLLKQFIRREDPGAFAQRKAIFENITQAVSRKVMTGFYRVGRLDNAKKILTFEDKQANVEARLNKLNNTLSTFYGANDLDDYLATRFIQLCFIDPNAFIAIDFKDFDSRYEVARPYPIELTSKHVIDFGYENNDLEYLIWLKPLSATTRDGKTVVINRYTMYIKDFVIKVTEHPDQVADVEGVEYIQIGTKGRYAIDVFNSGGGAIQAIRVGYENDLATEGRTKVNPLHDALPYFRKMVKTVSEFDLSMCLHAFPQKVELAQKCDGEGMHVCNEGKNDNGETCGSCGGSGWAQSHSSAQDVIRIPMPDRSTINPIGVDKVLAYYSPPVELLKFQDEQIEKLSTKVLDTIYGNDVLAKTHVVQTATERTDKKDEMYNALFPFAKQYSNIFRFGVRLCAAFTDNSQGLIVIHEFPKDFKLKTITELLADLDAATKSGAPAFVIQEIHKDIAAKLYADDPDAYAKYMVKAKFTPFLGKEVKEIGFILSSGYARLEDQVLYTHSDTIFDELEQEVANFFKLPYDRQWGHIKAKIEAIAPDLLLNKQASAVDFRDLAAGAGAIDPLLAELEAAGRLKGSVGGVQGILEVQSQVAAGITQYDAGLAILKLIYKIEEKDARQLLGTQKALEDATV